jgi:hypothetical protein
MAVRGDTLYVADRKNHLIREVDLKAKTVRRSPAPACRTTRSIAAA